LARDSLGVNGPKVLFQSDGVGNTMPRPTKAAAMQNIPIYEALAQAFAAEGVDTHFTLMGHGKK
jgi:hypothetical protein